MNCPHCDTLNPAQARFCLDYGHPLVSGLVCTTCHTLLPVYARFCFHCGVSAGPFFAAHIGTKQSMATVSPTPCPSPRGEEKAPSPFGGRGLG
jgi:hypothetical protein